VKKTRLWLLILLVAIALALPISAKGEIKENNYAFDKLTDNIVVSHQLTDGLFTKKEISIQSVTTKQNGKKYKVEHYVDVGDNFKAFLFTPKIESTYTFNQRPEKLGEYAFGYTTTKTIKPLGEFYSPETTQTKTIKIDYSKEAENYDISFKYWLNTVTVTLSHKNSTYINDLRSQEGAVLYVDPIIEEFLNGRWVNGTFVNTYNDTSDNLILEPDAILSMSFDRNNSYAMNNLTVDDSYYGNNGDISTPSLSLSNDSFRFDGVNDYIKVSDDIGEPNINHTVLLWTKYSNAGAYERMLFKEIYLMKTGAGNAIQVQWANATTNDVVYGTISPLNDNRWHLLGYRWTVDDSSNRVNLSILVDGRVDISAIRNNSISGLVYTNPTYIGSFGSSFFYNGEMGSVQVFNRSLSDAEILALNSSAKDFVNASDVDLLGGWALNSTYYRKTLDDLSTYGNDGDLGVFYTAGNHSGAVEFDGSNDIITGFNLETPTDSFSASAWIYPRGLPSYHTILRWGSQGAATGHAWWNVRSTQISLSMANGTVMQVNKEITSPLNRWTHFTVVYDGSTETVYHYQDGVLVGSESIINLIMPTNNNNAIGAYVSSDGQFNGSIDEVRIFDRALSHEEITCLWNGTSCPTGLNQTNVPAYYQSGNYTSQQFPLNETSSFGTFTLQGTFNGNHTIEVETRSFDSIWSSWQTCSGLSIPSTLSCAIASPDGTQFQYRIIGNTSDLSSTWNISSLQIYYGFYNDIIINSPINTYYNTNNITINITGGDDVNTTWFWNGTANFNETYTGVTTRNFSEGINTIYAYNNNTIGQINWTSTTFTVDTTNPSISITAPTNTTYSSQRTSLTYTATDTNLNACWYSTDEGATNTTVTCNDPISTTSTEGSNTWYVWANDSAGNLAGDSVTFVVDLTNPSVTIIYPTATTYNNAITELNFSAHDTNLNACWYSPDGGATNTTVTCGENLTGISSSEGYNTWLAYANDTSGRIGSDSVIFIQDTTAPTITNPIYSYLTDTSVEIAFTTNEPANYSFIGDLTNSYSSFTTNHELNPTGLSQNTTYNYNITTCDQYQNCATYSGYNFTTKNTPVTSSGDSVWMIAVILTLAVCSFLVLSYANSLGSENIALFLKTIFHLLGLAFIPITIMICKIMVEGVTSFSHYRLENIGNILSYLYIISWIIVLLVMGSKFFIALWEMLPVKMQTSLKSKWERRKRNNG